MMDRFLRLASIALIAAGFAACDDETAAPQGDPSTVNVSVYIEDSENTDGDGDDPIVGATVTLTPTDEGGESFTGTTNAEGIASFANVPAGVYTLTHEPAAPIANAVLTGTEERTLVAQFEGGTTNAEFVYSYNPGSITLQIFRDEDDNDLYDPVIDTTLAGFQALLFRGTDTTGSPVASPTLDATGLFVFDDIAQGAYTLLLRPIVSSEFADSTIAVNVVAGQNTDVLVEFTGGESCPPSPALCTITLVREAPAGQTVTIEGKVTAGINVFNTAGFYVQDPTGAIAVFQGGILPDTVPVAQGDSVRITGVTGVNQGEVQIAGGAAMSITVLATGRPLPAPRVVTSADVNAGLYQGELVVINAITLDSLNAASGAFSFNENVFGHDASGNAIIFIDGTTGIDSTYINYGETYNITGIMTRFNALLEIKPRNPEDLDMTSTPAGTVPLAQARLLPDGAGPITVTGVVTAGTGTYDATTAYIQDNTAGIVVDQFGRTPVTALAVGDSVTITANIDVFNAEPRMQANNSATVTNHGPASAPRAPVNITCAEVMNGVRQGELNILPNVLIISVTAGPGSNHTVVAEDNSGRCVVFLDSTTGLGLTSVTQGSRYSIIGEAATFTTRQFKPRSAADITLIP